MKNNLINKNAVRVFLGLLALCLLQLQFGCKLERFLSSNNNPGSNNKPGDSTTGASEGNLSAICSNAYYPVGEKIEKKYQIKYQKSPALDQDFTERYINFSGDGFSSKSEFKEVSSTINWRCTADGLLATTYGNTIEMKSGAGVKLDTLNSKGVSFPAESRWNTGEKWTTDYDVKETIKDSKGQEMGSGDGTVHQTAEIIGAEEITVPAGTFQTFKVKIKTNIDIVVKIRGASVPAKTALDTSIWFAKNVGMVKAESDLGGTMTSTTELLSSKK